MSTLALIARLHRAGLNALLQAMALLHLADHGPHAVKSMAAHLKVPVPALQSAIRRLARDGFVRTWTQRPPSGALCHGGLFRAVEITKTGLALLTPDH